MGAGNVAPAPVRATPLKLPEPLPLLLLHAAPTTAITRPAATSRSMPPALVIDPLLRFVEADAMCPRCPDWVAKVNGIRTTKRQATAAPRRPRRRGTGPDTPEAGTRPGGRLARPVSPLRRR